MSKRNEPPATPVVTLACGCQHDARAWIHECQKDKAEHAALHEQAAADHRRQANEDLR